MEEKAAWINGHMIETDSGGTILDKAKELNIHIPTLCHFPQGKSLGSCGVCVVENRANGELFPSCSTILEAGMDIRTESEKVVEARRAAITKLVNSGQHNCFVLNMPSADWTSCQLQIMTHPWHQVLCPAWGRCELQNLVVKYGVDPVEPYGEDRQYPLDDRHPMFVRDYSRCIRCGRCIQACNDVQVNLAIPMPDQWEEGSASPEQTYPLVNYDRCVHCGECVQACPVGALFEKKGVSIMRRP